MTHKMYKPLIQMAALGTALLSASCCCNDFPPRQEPAKVVPYKEGGVSEKKPSRTNYVQPPCVRPPLRVYEYEPDIIFVPVHRYRFRPRRVIMPVYDPYCYGW